MLVKANRLLEYACDLLGNKFNDHTNSNSNKKLKHFGEKHGELNIRVNYLAETLVYIVTKGHQVR